MESEDEFISPELLHEQRYQKMNEQGFAKNHTNFWLTSIAQKCKFVTLPLKK